MKWSPLFPVLIFLIGFTIRVSLVHAYPAVFGGDTVLRLANRDRILLAYQLPALQTIIYSVSQWTDALLPIRYVMAGIGAAAGTAFYWLAQRFLEDRRAFCAALLLTSNPFLIQLSIVPYQEVLMLGALLLAFYLFFIGNTWASSAALGLACLTRYEAWAACPVLALAYAAQGGLSARRAIQGILLFVWAPLAWMTFNRGLSPAGTFVLDAPLSIYRLIRYVYLGWITVKNTPPPVLLLAGIGLWSLYRLRAWTEPKLRLLTGFFALFLLAILFSAHGEMPDPQRFVTAREATIIITAVIFVAGYAINRSSRAIVTLAIAGVVWGVCDAYRFVHRDTSTPKVQLSLRLAEYLDKHVKQSESVVLLTAPIPRALVQHYLDGAIRQGGAAGLARAREIMASMDTSPPDYQRTLIHSCLGRRRLISLASTPLADGKVQRRPEHYSWVALWSDFQPTNEIENQIYRTVHKQEPTAIVGEEPFSVSIYRLQDPTI